MDYIVPIAIFCYVNINHVLWPLLQDTLLLKSTEEGDLESIRESLTKQANINIADEVYTMIMYLYFTVKLQKIQ